MWILAVGVVREVKPDALGRRGVLGWDGKARFLFLQAIIGEGMEEIEEVCNFIVSKTKVAKVVMIDCIGEIGNAPVFGF